MKKVTIGLPVFNCPLYIKDAINSIKNQSCSQWVCIILDDGSTDSTPSIIASLIQDDSRFIFMQDNKNIGLPNRLNQIASLTETPYLARMDADDIMLPDRIETQLQILESYSDIDVVGGGAYIIDVNNSICGMRDAPMQINTEAALKGSLFIHPTVMGRTQWFRENKYDPNKRRSEDYDLWLRTVEFSKFIQSPKPMIFYREIGMKHAKKYNATMTEILSNLANHPLRSSRKMNKLVKRKMLSVAFKIMVFRVFSKFGLQHVLIVSRSKKLSTELLLQAALLLNQALRDSNEN